MFHWDEHNSQTELKEIIEACPHLVTLELRNFPLPHSHTYKQLNCDSLRNLFLSPKEVLDNEHCKALAHLNLKLEKPTLFGLNSSDQRTMKSLSKFLSTLSESLQFLELWLDYGSVLSQQGSEHHSPLTVVLRKVTKLQTESAILGHINNIRKLPSITELEIVSHHREVRNWSGLTNRAVTTTHSSSLRSFCCGDIDCKSLGKVMKVFPQITSLNIYATNVDDKLLRSIFTNLTLLLELTISPCFKTQLLPISDSGITGIQAGKCAKLQKKFNKFDNNDPVSVEEVQSQPHIGKLQSLQILDLSFSVSDIMTDVSILHGISRLTKLNTLKLPICRITGASLSIVEKRLEQLIILGIAGCKQITSKAIADLKQRRKGILIDVNLPPDVLEKFS